MASTILSLPFRRTHAVKLSDAIKQYISNKYDQHPNMFRDDLVEIDRLRMEAVNSTDAHVSGIPKMTIYAAQLVYMGGKFPIDMGAEFTWYPSLGFNVQQPLSQDNIRFDLCNILFNLAVLYSQLAVAANRHTSEGLKSACNYFCRAAGILHHIKEKVMPELRGTAPEDMDPMTLQCLQHLLLAQGQECFWAKAVKDGMKDGTIAKLAAKVSDFYDQAADYGTKSDVVSTEWIHHMTAKHHHFAGAAQYRASRECLEKQEYGEEVARLRDGLRCVSEGLKESRWINKTVVTELNGLKARITEDLKRAEKDNDVIYLQAVTPKSELKTISRVGMATIRVPEEIVDPYAALSEQGSCGRPLFSRLVPYAVHVAASIYEERKDRMVKKSIIGEIEALTAKIRTVLQSLNLPGSLQALERPLGVPPSLIAHGEEIRRTDGLHNLRRLMHDTSGLKENDVTIYREGVQILESEAAEDDAARVKHGSMRWNRPVSTKAAEKLYTQVQELDGYLKSATHSDELVMTRLKDNERLIQILSGPVRQLEDYVPNSRRTAIEPVVSQAATELRRVLDEIELLEERRARFAAKLGEKSRMDDINDVILTETTRIERDHPFKRIEPADFEDLFESRLARYADDQKLVSKEARLQEDLLAQLHESNENFLQARKANSGSGTSPISEREKILQSLETSYVRFCEICENVETGREFYNRLAKIVTHFRDDCRGFAYQRRLEAKQFEAELDEAHFNSRPISLAGLNLGKSRSNVSLEDGNLNQHRKHNINLDQDHQTMPASSTTIRSPYQAISLNHEPISNSVNHGIDLAAPVPTRIAKPSGPVQNMWTPDAGIRFDPTAPSTSGGLSYPQAQSPLIAIDNQSPPSSFLNVTHPRMNGAQPGPWDATKGLRFA